jgi:hypothetical protein
LGSVAHGVVSLAPCGVLVVRDRSFRRSVPFQHAHAGELEKLGVYHATVEDIPSGARLTVTASDAGNTATIAKIRGLGFMGLLTLGDHHAAHHA